MSLLRPVKTTHFLSWTRAFAIGLGLFRAFSLLCFHSCHTFRPWRSVRAVRCGKKTQSRFPSNAATKLWPSKCQVYLLPLRHPRPTTVNNGIMIDRVLRYKRLQLSLAQQAVGKIGEGSDRVYSDITIYSWIIPGQDEETWIVCRIPSRYGPLVNHGPQHPSQLNSEKKKNTHKWRSTLLISISCNRDTRSLKHWLH